MILHEISQTQKGKYTWSQIYVESKIAKHIEAENRRVVARSWGERNRGVLGTNTSVQGY